MEKKTQLSEVKRYLETHKRGLSQRDAIDYFGAYRLSDIILKLRRAPYNMNIRTVKAHGPNRYGGTSYYAIYKLEE